MMHEGHLDRIDSGRVFGWAWQSDLGDDPVSVDLYVDDLPAGRIVAASYRADLEKAGKGNGRHAFEIRLPDSCFDGDSHSVRVCYQGTNVDLYGSPQTICLKSKATAGLVQVYANHIQLTENRHLDWPELKLHDGHALAGESITALPNPKNAKVLPHFRLFAILGTWMEADIVGANIRNAVTQGCERVYLVDNGSTDGTVEIAQAEGAVLARSFQTERYDEALRLRHMNDVVSEVSEVENDSHIWWLFLDGDEFPHGPWGMTLHEYLKTLDDCFRIVGIRFFDHYPNRIPEYMVDRHPLDFQPLCEEVALPMCPSNHRKHPLQRYDRGRARIACGNGFHLAYCAEPLYEPSQPAFLHHFPFRLEAETRKRLDALWTKDRNGTTRALAARDTHMLARSRSFDAVYAHDWVNVVNFITLDPICNDLKSRPPDVGVHPEPWPELVEAGHQHVLRWYSPISAWNYETVEEFAYGDDVTYKKGIAFLDGHGSIEDWGCGFAHARSFVTKSEYVGIDGSSKRADKIVDLRKYTSNADCIFMRHVLEHNFDWRRILANAVASFGKRMVLVIFTPLAETTRVIATSTDLTSVPVPDISFRKEDLTEHFTELKYSEESLQTATQYQTEHVFYIEKQPLGVVEHLGASAARALQIDEELRIELDAWTSSGIGAKFWWRDDDAVRDTPQLRRLLGIAREAGIVVALAVVPEHADASLAQVVSTPNCCVWQHGWSHDFHAAGEFGDGRRLDLMTDDALAGQRSLDRLFGPAGWQRVFVPPNHMLSMAFKTLIPSLGYLGVSSGVQLTPPIEHVVEINAEIDVMNWPEGRVLGASAVGETIVEQLKARRMGKVPLDRPIGILTHHLVFDENAWEFIITLLGRLKSHPGVEMLRADALFVDPKVRTVPAPPSQQRSAVKSRDITVVITSCGRQDLLVQTLDSFLKYNTYPIREIIVIEDGEAEKNLALQERYRQHNFRWLSSRTRVGQIGVIDIAYRSVETEYIFHCEDDWEFLAPGFIEKSLAVMNANADILQVWLRALTDTNKHPVMDYLFFANDVPYRLIHPEYHSEEWGTWHGFSFNPGLKRRSDYLLIGSFAVFDPLREKKSFEVEREAAEFYFQRGFLAAILADNGGKGYVRHIGWNRRVVEVAHEVRA